MGFVIGNVSSSIVQYYDSFILPVGGGGGGGGNVVLPDCHTST